MGEDCDYCNDGECLAHTEPDYDAIAADLADHDWHQGEPTRWAGIDTPN